MQSLATLMQVQSTGVEDQFEGAVVSYGRLGIYGGHFLGQALSAGLATVDETKLAHSFHAYFIKAGDPASPLYYNVSRLKQGRNSELREIVAVQADTVVFKMIAAFKLPEVGAEHQKIAPQVVAADEIIAKREARGVDAFPFPVTQGGRVEMEFASESFFPAKFVNGREPVLRTWMRVPGCEQLDARSRQPVMAYLSDGTLMFNSVVPHGTPFQTHRLTSLDQSVWFHRDTDPGEWMLYDQRSTAAVDGRGLNEGEVYDKHGVLVLSAAQESMLRGIVSDKEVRT